jgi:hypothetical protein
MEKEFIPYEQALALKELGFDEPCFGRYGNDSKMLYKDYSKELHSNWHTMAPLWQQAFSWFRDKYNLNSFVIDSMSYNWYFNINEILKDDVISEVLYFKTYKKAELECLKKLIEIVKNQ